MEPSIPIKKHSIDNPAFVEGNRYCPHDARDAVADTHAPGFQPEAPAGRSQAGVPRGPKSTKPGAKPPGGHNRSNVLKLFTKVRAAQGPWPCCTRSGWARRMQRRTFLLTGSSPPTEPSTPIGRVARPRTGSTVDLDDFPTEHWVHLSTTDPIESVFGTGAPHRSDHELCAAGEPPRAYLQARPLCREELQAAALLSTALLEAPPGAVPGALGGLQPPRGGVRSP